MPDWGCEIKRGVNKGSGIRKREQTRAQQCAVVARRPVEQHDTETGWIEAEEDKPTEAHVTHPNRVYTLFLFKLPIKF